MLINNNVKNTFKNLCNHKQSRFHKGRVTDNATETLRIFVLTENSLQKVWNKI